MNSDFKNEVMERLLGCDEAMLAEVFNTFASDYDNREFVLRKDDAMVFNIEDNRQAAMAVRKFGFDAVEKASKDGWMIYAEKGSDGRWSFTAKAPSEAVSDNIEPIILDIIARPREYPSWIWNCVSGSLINHLATAE